MSELTPKQQRFVDEYVVDLHARNAAIRAGYSAKSAQMQSSRLLTNEQILSAVQGAEANHLNKVGVRAFKVLQELALIGFSDIRHYQIDDDGDVSLSEDAPAWAMRAVSSLKKKIKKIVTEDGEIVTTETELKLWNKNNALENLGKHLQIFGDNSVNLNLGIKIVFEDTVEATAVLPAAITLKEE